MSRAIEIINDEDLNWIRDDDHGFGGLRTSEGHLPLKAMSVHANIAGVFVRTVVEQTFVNNFDAPLEATYIFPLPDRAAVSAFREETKQHFAFPSSSRLATCRDEPLATTSAAESPTIPTKCKTPRESHRRCFWRGTPIRSSSR